MSQLDLKSKFEFANLLCITITYETIDKIDLLCENKPSAGEICSGEAVYMSNLSLNVS